MEPKSNVQEVVMRRVHRINRIRPLLSSGALACVLLVATLYALGREVWVARVMANMPSVTDVQATTRFFTTAFFNTTFVVQVLTLVAMAAVIWLAREMVLALARTPSHRFA